MDEGYTPEEADPGGVMAKSALSVGFYYWAPGFALRAEHVLDLSTGPGPAYGYREHLGPGSARASYVVRSLFEGPEALYGRGTTYIYTANAQPLNVSMVRCACGAGVGVAFEMPCARGGRRRVILRRSMDFYFAHQYAEVRVNGRAAGVWHTSGRNPAFRLREEDFVIPREAWAQGDWLRIELRLPCVEGGGPVWTHGVYTLLVLRQ